LTITVAVNERGRRIGDSHPNAKLSDRDIELLLALRSERWTYDALRIKFGVSKSCVAQICRGEKRNHTAVAFKSVHLTRKR
ncbi:MAG: hypothetical protein IT456_22315, partial [Planctomycetes bacterium]|nr:hypothetical protein [Planctomycetota bacterium]